MTFLRLYISTSVKWKIKCMSLRFVGNINETHMKYVPSKGQLFCLARPLSSPLVHVPVPLATVLCLLLPKPSAPSPLTLSPADPGFYFRGTETTRRVTRDSHWAPTPEAPGPLPQLLLFLEMPNLPQAPDILSCP